MSGRLSADQRAQRHSSQAYELFILVLTVISLLIMVAMFLPFGDSTLGLLQFYDNAICVIFLLDFGMRLRRAKPRSAYFVGERGWLDLLGSIPSFGVAFRFTGLFRLARISRLARIARLMRGKQRRDLARDMLANRSKYALFITVLTTMVVLCTASVIVLQFESRSAEANIDNGWDAFWYSVVTLTTVGYGDFYPVTVAGRLAAMFIMVAGVGVIGALASILASVLVGDSSTGPAAEADGAGVEVAPGSPQAARIESELAAIRAELDSIRALLERRE